MSPLIPARPGSKPEHTDLGALTARVDDLENWKGQFLGSVAIFEKSLHKLEDKVGEEPTQGDPDSGKGLLRTVSRLSDTVGEEPSELKQKPGSGMARTITEIHTWMKNDREARTEEKKAPVERMKKLQNVGMIIGLILSTITLLSACTAAASWFVKQTASNIATTQK